MRSVPYLHLWGLCSLLCLTPTVLAAPPGANAPLEVVVETVRAADLAYPMEFAGRTSGYREVEVRGQVSGILQQRTYEEGSQVKEGQLLFRIDPRPYQAALSRAKAALAQEQARFNQAQRNLQRIRQLQHKGFASGSELDNAISSYEQSKANIQAAEAEIQTRQIDLDYTLVRAPISGITSKQTRSEGSLVVAGDPSASLLTQITQLDPLYINFAYPDQVLERLRADLQRGDLQLPADGKLRVELVRSEGEPAIAAGHVDFTDSLITRSTGTVSARAVVANPKQVLLPGQFVRVRVTGLVYPAILTIPERALVQTTRGTSVFVIDSQDVARERPVRTGPTLGQRWLILDGLKTGERVVVEGLAKLMADVPVKVVSASAAQQAGAAQ
jgi:membrane fusion protein (multidrug efflux system)